MHLSDVFVCQRRCIPVTRVSRPILQLFTCIQLLVPRVRRRSAFGTRTFSVAGPTVWDFGIHCLIIYAIQLLTPNNLGGTWRRMFRQTFER